MGLFDAYTNSNDPFIKQAATLLDEATVQYKNGQLSPAEYQEIVGDILDFNKISATITDIVRIQAITDAFNALITIVSTVTSI